MDIFFWMYTHIKELNQELKNSIILPEEMKDYLPKEMKE